MYCDVSSYLFEWSILFSLVIACNALCRSKMFRVSIASEGPDKVCVEGELEMAMVGFEGMVNDAEMFENEERGE